MSATATDPVGAEDHLAFEAKLSMLPVTSGPARKRRVLTISTAWMKQWHLHRHNFKNLAHVLGGMDEGWTWRQYRLS